MSLTSLVIPLLLAGTASFALGKKVDVYAALTKGAEEGLGVLLRIIPALVGLLTAVAMGALPGGKPLSDRRNIVLTKGSLSVEGAETVHSCRELQSLLDGEAEESVFVIGGGSVYAALLPLCRRVLVTKVDADVEADTFFPNLDKLPNWTVLSESGPYTENGLTYRFIDYGNTSL